MRTRAIHIVLTIACLSVFVYALGHHGARQFPSIHHLLPPPISLSALGVLVFFDVLFWYGRLRHAILPYRAARKTTLPRYPSVTVVRPVRGRDVGAEDNFRAALDTGYPGEVETLFIFDEDSDPGLPLAQKVVAEHVAAGRPGSAQVLVAGAPPPGRTGKLNAMILGEGHAHGELIAFGDSDTRPDHNVLRGVVEALLTTDKGGSAFAPVLVYQPLRKAGDALYALMLNAMYSPIASYVSGARRQLPFIMGQLMVFTRQALTAIGGVACAEGQLVDDMYIGQCVHRAGFRNVMSRAPLHIATGPMTLAEYLPIYGRWMRFSRNGMPLSFTWRQWLVGVQFWMALLLTLISLRSSEPVAALPAGAALLLIGWCQISLHQRYGGAKVPLRLYWVAWGLFLIAPWVLVKNELKRDVVWRGRKYHVDEKAALSGAAHVRIAAA